MIIHWIIWIWWLKCKKQKKKVLNEISNLIFTLLYRFWNQRNYDKDYFRFYVRTHLFWNSCPITLNKFKQQLWTIVAVWIEKAHPLQYNLFSHTHRYVYVHIFVHTYAELNCTDLKIGTKHLTWYCRYHIRSRQSFQNCDISVIFIITSRVLLHI